MNSEKSDLHQQIVRYYEICDTDYAFFWHLRSRMAMHYGYWDKDTKNLKQALWNMNDQMARAAKIQPNDLVLDAGCGIGGSCFYIAQKIRARIHGITLSERHVREANALARERKVDDKVSFSVSDYCNTTFPDGHFDVVWALESACHAAKKPDFIREAFRILKPGGTLVVGDFFQKENLTVMNAGRMQVWANSWAVPFFETGERFLSMLEEAGFQNVLQKNINANIAQSSRILNRYFLPGLLSNWIMPVFGKRKNSVQQKNVWSVRLQHTTFQKGLWNYLIFTAQKPQ